jgi:hypothetical protein
MHPCDATGGGNVLTTLSADVIGARTAGGARTTARSA